MPRVDGDEPRRQRTLPCQAETRRKQTYRAYGEDARQITGQPSRRLVELQARGRARVRQAEWLARERMLCNT